MTPQQAAALTDEEIRVKVAELEGWHVGIVGGQCNWHPEHGGKNRQLGGPCAGLPDYSRDLNAIFEAENAIIEKQPSQYQRREMEELIDLNIMKVMRSTSGTRPTTRATARQRCEALLVTMGGME